MKYRLMLLLCAAFGATDVSAAVTPLPAMEQPILVTRIDCRIVIDKQGRVAEYTPKTELPALLAERVGEMVKSVRFEPVEVDGKIVNAETTMRVAVSAKKLDDGSMRLAIDNLTFPPEKKESAAPAGQPTVIKRAPIRYPKEALRYELDADVLVALLIGPDGRVRDAAVQQSALVHRTGNPREVAKALQIFEKAALQVLRQWETTPFALSDMPAHERVADGYIAYVPVQFRIDRPMKGGIDGVGQWTLETRTVKRVPAWAPVDAKAPQPSASDLAQGEEGGVNTRYRLAVPLAALSP
ncbi:energy transducer TonB [Cognatilysobacter terrigena]|uniref:energy transducer TonB n=1 Tax=Cognatilysobacter terrigena TaxID=2488749 RepID=UPI0014151676|nr:energy transducer TonB [Lysobacter terrigena]